MINKLIIAIFLGLSVFANAQVMEGGNVTCYLTDQFDDWNVYVGMSDALFFDNNENIPLVASFNNGPNVVYTFSDQYEYIEFEINRTNTFATLNIYPKTGEAPQGFAMVCGQ